GGDSDSQTDSDPLAPIHAEAMVSWEASFQMEPYAILNNGLYYPYIALSASILANAVAYDQDSEETGEAESFKSWSLMSWEEFPTSSPVTVDMHGFIITAYEALNDEDSSTGVGVSAMTSIGVPAISIQPVEFWPYDPDDG